MVGGLIPSKNGEGITFDEYNCYQYYKEVTDCWESLTDPSPFVGRLYSVSYMDGGLLMTGGMKKGTTCKCWLFYLATKKLKSMPPLNTTRCHRRSVSLGKSNGMDVDKKTLASVECLDTKRQQWLFMPAMPQLAWNKKKSSAIEQYDPLTDTWSYCSIAPLKQMLSRHIMMNIDLHDM